MPFKYNAVTGRLDIVNVQGGGGSGDVTGPGSSTSGNLPSFADTTGKLLQDSGIPSSTVLVDSDIGTNVQAYNANLDDFSSLTAVEGDLIYGNATPEWAKLTIGSNGQVLTVNSGLPSWVTPPTDLYLSPYIVDASGDAGSSYTTIQDAIDQASIDNPTEFSLIVIRPGTYSGNITISSSEQICLVAEPTGSDQYSSDTPTIISGLVTINSGGTLNASGIFCNRAVSSIVNNGILRLVNSFFGILTQAAQFSAYECSGTTLTTSGTNSRLYNCQWFGLSASSGTVSMFDCYNLNNGSVSGSASVFADNSRWIGSNVNDGLSGSTSGTVQITNCTMNCANLTAGTIRISGLKPTTYTDAEIYDPTAGATYEQFPCMQGNLVHGIQTATNLTITKGMFYVGITDTTSARTLTLPDTTTATLKAMRGQTFIFKDESGGATTNNITLATNGGNIDGAASYVINLNYGSITLMFDGTNYWVI